MKNKAQIVAEVNKCINSFSTMSKFMGKEALAAKRKYQEAGPGDYHFELWMRYRAEAYDWGHAARKCKDALQ